jgi:hypothetical protein
MMEKYIDHLGRKSPAFYDLISKGQSEEALNQRPIPPIVGVPICGLMVICGAMPRSASAGSVPEPFGISPASCAIPPSTAPKMLLAAPNMTPALTKFITVPIGLSAATCISVGWLMVHTSNFLNFAHYYRSFLSFLYHYDSKFFAAASNIMRGVKALFCGLDLCA